MGLAGVALLALLHCPISSPLPSSTPLPTLHLPAPALLPHVALLQAEQLTRLVGEFYTQEQKYSFVHAFNHRQSEFDFKRMLDSMGHATAELPRD
jgi:hypothetical protein